MKKSRLLSILALLLVAVSGAWAQDTYTVTFKANNKTKTVENVTLPKTFSCDYFNENGELDLIIKELYGFTGGFCYSDQAPSSSGSENVTCGIDGDNNQYITVSAPFDGTATVTGKYYNYDTADIFDYSLEITCPQPAPARVVINEANFPDANFRSFLLAQSYGEDGILTDADIASVTSITARAKNFQSLQGIEFFTALTGLDCRGNQLTALDISQNTALTSLTLSQNQLTSLDVSKNTALQTLQCDRNQLTALDVTKNTALQTLHCYENQLTALDVTKNTELKNLHCSYNPLTALNVSQNTALRTLNCYGNQLTALDVTENTLLTSLQCNNNQFTTIDVSKNTALRTLYCYENQLTALDVSQNTALRTLQCYKNQIKGAAMDAFIESLNQPETGWGELNIIFNENEQNELTATQVAAIKAKKWSPRAFNGTNWKEYAGPVVISEADDNSSWIEANNDKLADITLTRTLQTGGWNTFAVPFDAAIPTGWTVKQLTGATVSGNTLTLTFGDATAITAGTPYLVKVETAVENPPFAGALINNNIPGVSFDAVDFIPTLGNTDLPAGKESILFIGANNTLYHPSDEGQQLKGFRAYFVLKGNAVNAQSFSIDLGDDATAIEAVNADDNVNINGNVNLCGQRVGEGYKGIVIMNGKKVIK